MFEAKALSPWARRRRDGEVSVALATLGADFSLLEDSDSQIGVDAFEPWIACQKNVLIWCLPSGRSLRCLLDSGAELDLLDAKIVQDEALPLRRLLAPLHLRLGTTGKTDCLAHFAITDFSSGRLTLANRPFFVGNVSGYDAILGLPFIEDMGIQVGNGSVSRVPAGPSREPVRLSEMGAVDLQALGFTRELMNEEQAYQWAGVSTLIEEDSGDSIGTDGPEVESEDSELFAFAQVSMISSVVARGDLGVLGTDEIIEREPHNLLLNVVNDPSIPDLTAEQAQVELDATLEEFSNVFVDSLLMDQLLPFCPVNHTIPLLDELLKIRLRAYPMPDKYRAQWVEHVDAYVKNGWWNPGSLDSACALFAIPKKEPGTACFVVNLKPRNVNTLKMHTPIPDMRTIWAEIAGAPHRSAVDMAAAFEQVRVVPTHVS
jgi:hypothetical protein